MPPHQVAGAVAMAVKIPVIWKGPFHAVRPSRIEPAVRGRPPGEGYCTVGQRWRPRVERDGHRRRGDERNAICYKQIMLPARSRQSISDYRAALNTPIA